MSNEFPVFEPAKTALLFGDYQVGILANYPSADEVVAKAVRVREAAKKAGLTVGFIRVGFTEADYAAIPAENKVFSTIAASKRLQADDESTKIVEALTPVSDEIVVRKTRFGGFSTTDLYEQLQTRGIKNIVIGGVATSGVVLSTVRDASDKDMGIYVIKDLCLDADPQVHEVLTEKLFPRQGWVITSEEFISSLG